MFEHGFVDDDSLGLARDDVHAALEACAPTRASTPTRVGLWFFSAGGLLMGSFLDPVPRRRGRASAGTYAAVATPTSTSTDLAQALDTAATSTVAAAAGAARARLRLDRAGHRRPARPLPAAGRPVDVIDVPGAHHGFETVDDTDESRAAVRASIDWWVDALAVILSSSAAVRAVPSAGPPAGWRDRVGRAARRTGCRAVPAPAPPTRRRSARTRARVRAGAWPR